MPHLSTPEMSDATHLSTPEMFDATLLHPRNVWCHTLVYPWNVWCHTCPLLKCLMPHLSTPEMFDATHLSTPIIVLCTTSTSTEHEYRKATCSTFIFVLIGDIFLTFLYMCDSHIGCEIHASHITLPFLWLWQCENIVKTKYYVLWI